MELRSPVGGEPRSELGSSCNGQVGNHSEREMASMAALWWEGDKPTVRLRQTGTVHKGLVDCGAAFLNCTGKPLES